MSARTRTSSSMGGLGDLFGFFGEGPKLDSATLFNLNPITKKQSLYLQKVYTLMAAGVLTAAASAYYSPRINPLILLISLMVFLLAIPLTAHRQYEGWYVYGRPAMFFLVCTIVGASIQETIQMADYIDPSMVQTAALASIAGFTSLSLAAVLNFKSRTFLMMATTIGSLTMFIASVSLMNYFMRSRIVIDLINLAQFGMTILYTLFDTQVALASVEHNRTDYVSHALQFFMNLIKIFLFILEQLMKKNNDNDDDSRRGRRRRKTE